MSILLRGGCVWDGSAAEPEPRDVHIVDDSVDAVAYPGKAPPDDDTFVVELDGAYVLPGLIDSHVHLVWSGEPDPASAVASQGEQMTTIRAVTNGRAQLDAGVTTVRDLGSVADIAVTVAKSIDRGHLEGPTVVAAGRTVIMTGGHDPFWGIFADGVDAVTAAVRQQVYTGADVIKTAATGGVYGRTEGEDIGQSELSYAELAALTTEAHRFGRKVAAHALGTEGIENAVNAGVDTVEHGVFLTEDIAGRMAAQGTVLCPTLATYRVLAEGAGGTIPHYATAKATKVVDAHRQSLAMALDAGVDVIAGTDAGACALPHPALVDELEILNAYGLSIVDTLKAATSRAAAALGRPRRGIVAAGAAADLLIVERDPFSDLQALRTPLAVVRAGRTVAGDRYT